MLILKLWGVKHESWTNLQHNQQAFSTVLEILKFTGLKQNKTKTKHLLVVWVTAEKTSFTPDTEAVTLFFCFCFCFFNFILFLNFT